MIDPILTANPVILALLAGCGTWALTALGASTVFLTHQEDRRLLDTMLGFAGGVMIAASFWSLLAPAVELSGGGRFPAWIHVGTGFLIGGIFLRVVDYLIPHLHIGFPTTMADGPASGHSKSTLLILAIALHNIPEGLAMGIAFGAVAAGFPHATLAGAVALALGIGVQNFPEGLAVSLPLRREGNSASKSFFCGQISGVVEPLSAFIGAAVVIGASSLLPYALAFAAGAMIFVVVEEVIPESQIHGNTDLATMGTLLGFVVMMALGIGLG
ncbi:MAG: ZIP family metal transporter [Methanomicrobiales archaeon]|nr:ZIP family metal transporter [Methanomicrobiales archaeon]